MKGSSPSYDKPQHCFPSFFFNSFLLFFHLPLFFFDHLLICLAFLLWVLFLCVSPFYFACYAFFFFPFIDFFTAYSSNLFIKSVPCCFCYCICKLLSCLRT